MFIDIKKSKKIAHRILVDTFSLYQFCEFPHGPNWIQRLWQLIGILKSNLKTTIFVIIPPLMELFSKMPVFILLTLLLI